MQAPFPVIAPGIFLYKPLRVEKARHDINEIDAPPLDIPLSFRFIPCKPHILLYVQIVCMIKSFLHYAEQNKPLCLVCVPITMRTLVTTREA
jgi:hypothetical protein